MSESAVHIENLTKVFKGEIGQKDFTAVDHLNLDVRQGEVFAFLGPNGAGKTTTIKLMMRLLYPTGGDISILGKSNKDPHTMQRVGYFPEQPNIYGYLKGYEFLDFMGDLFGLDRKVRQKRAKELLERLGLGEDGNRQVRSYSRGMVQRLGLAQALINDPMVLFLDEPMSNLDPIGRKDVRDLILELKSKGKTIFFSSHILSDAEMIADRVGILKKGKLVNVGPLDAWTGSGVQSVEVTFTLPGGKQKKMGIGENAVIQGDKIMVRFEKEADVQPFIKKISDSGGTVISVIPEKASLEELFMAEMGR